MNRLSILIAATLLVASTSTLRADDAPPVPREDAPLPEKLNTVPPPEEEPTVNIRAVDNGDTVEEYRLNGRLTMVKVRPTAGVPYTLIDTNGDGRLDRKDSEGPVAPVYWTLYEWD
jgi:hypothetical protein